MNSDNSAQPTQLRIEFEGIATTGNEKGAAFNDPAFASNKSLPIHRWVPWIAGFSKEFVSGAIEKYLRSEKGTILDPFAGVGTTLVEGMLRGHDVLGFEINPYPYLATRTKLNLTGISADELELEIGRFKAFYDNAVQTRRTPRTHVPAGFQSRIPFFSPRVLDKVLYVQDFITDLQNEKLGDVFRIAFASTIVTYSNYSYEPSLATRASSGKQNIDDALVGETVLQKLQIMLEDVRWFWRIFPNKLDTRRDIIHDSFFNAPDHILPETADLIITSPPYLNNYHYNLNTRPHLYWLGYAHKPSDLRPLEEANFGTYWQTARDRADVELQFSLPKSDLHSVLERLRDIHPEKGIYGGKGWAKYAATYFNDCLRFAQQAHFALKPGGIAVVVVGNSILQGIMISTDKYLAEIAELADFEVVGIDIPRSTRVGSSIIQSNVRSVKASAKHQLYEAVVTLRKK